MSEFASIEEQLNGIEKYAMYFLEEETAELAAEQLRLAEVLHVHTHYTYKIVFFFKRMKLHATYTLFLSMCALIVMYINYLSTEISFPYD